MLFFSLFYLALFKMSVIYLSSLLLFFFFPSSFVLPNEALSLQFFVSSPSILFLFSLLIFPSARMDNSNNSMQCRVLSRATKYQERGEGKKKKKKKKKISPKRFRFGHNRGGSDTIPWRHVSLREIVCKSRGRRFDSAG